MTLDAWLTLAVIAGTVVVLARELLPPAAAVLGAAVLLLLLGVIDTEQAFAGFSNPAPITVAALYVVASAVEATGALTPLVHNVMGSGAGALRQLARIVVPTAAASAFLNNTPIVAMLAPQVAGWASRRGVPASRFLMPVSYAAILGGVVTVIGTSTNVVVSGLLVEAGLPAIGMFEITRVGLPVAVAGLAVLVVAAPRLLPDRQQPGAGFVESARSFTMAMRVVPGGPLDGKTIEAAGLRQLRAVYCVEIERDGRVVAPVAPAEVLQGDDRLTFVGRVDDIVDVQQLPGIVSAEQHHIRSLDTETAALFEAVIGPESPLAGTTLKAAGFRERYQGAVLAIHRAGARLDAKLGEVELRAGDTLLVLTDPGFRQRWRDSRDFLLIARLGTVPQPRTRMAPLVGLVTLLLVVVAGSGIVPILHAALGAAVLLVALRAITPGDARGAVDIDVLVVIAASFALGAAVDASGLADQLALLLLGVSGPLGEVGALAAVLLATMALTETISNNAAAVLLFPIALSAAEAVGADPRPFAIAVALGASLSFLTPIGYQTNLMVYGLGGYRFGDYARLGLPINVVVVIVALLVIPLAWPL